MSKPEIDLSKNYLESAQYFLDHYEDRLPPPQPELKDKRHWTEIASEGMKILAEHLKEPSSHFGDIPE